MTSTIQGIPVSPTPLANGEGYVFNGSMLVPTAIGGGGAIAMLAQTYDNAQATTTSTTRVNLITHPGPVVSNGGRLVIILQANIQLNVGADPTRRAVLLEVQVDGAFVNATYAHVPTTTPAYQGVPICLIAVTTVAPAAGPHTIEGKWLSEYGGTIYANTYGNAETPTVLTTFEVG